MKKSAFDICIKAPSLLSVKRGNAVRHLLLFIYAFTCTALFSCSSKEYKDIVPKDSVLYVYNTIAAKSVTLVEIKTLTHDLFINNRYEEVKELITNFLRKKPKFGKYTKKI